MKSYTLQTTDNTVQLTYTNNTLANGTETVLNTSTNLCIYISISYYNKRNAHFDVQELLLQFWTERRETWQEYRDA